MDTFTAIQERRSVKSYDPEHCMTDAEIRQLMEAVLFSPTSFNMQNWRFVVVGNTEKKAALRSVAWNQAQLTDASIAVILCADLNCHLDAARYWLNAPEEVRDILVPMIAPFYSEKPVLQRDEAMRSVGIAGQTLMLAAKAMGYDSCPMIGFDPDKAAEIIDLPKDHVIGMIVVVGKALKPANERGGQLPYEEVVFADRFSD
jgi:nitroreductase